MSLESVEKFKKDLEENEELKKKFEEKLASEGEVSEKNTEIIAKVAKELGYDITEEDFKNAKSSNINDLKKGELSEEELDKVAGGAFWSGPDAPDGHEVGCLITYYRSWFSAIKSCGYCAKCGTRNIYFLNEQSDHPAWGCMNPSCDAISGIIDNKITIVGKEKNRGIKIIE